MNARQASRHPLYPRVINHIIYRTSQGEVKAKPALFALHVRCDEEIQFRI